MVTQHDTIRSMGRPTLRVLAAMFLTGTICLGGVVTGVPSGHPLRRAPTVDKVSVGSLPAPKLLATPKVRTLLGYTRRPLQLPDGHTTAVFSFSYSAPANWIFLIDRRNLASERYAVPHNDIASHGAALGADGNIYIMPYNTARAYCFSTEARTFEQVPTQVAEGEYTWDALGAKNGRIYFGTYPHAIFGEYDPVDGAWSLWPQVAPNTTYVTGLSEDGTGLIHFKAWGPDEVWMTFDPDTSEVANLEAPPAAPSPPDSTSQLPNGDESYVATVTAGDRRFAVGHPSGRFWEITESEAPKFCGDTGLPAEPLWWLKATHEEVFGVSYFGGLFRFDLATRAFTTGQVDNLAPAGNAIMFLETVTPRCAIGANYSQQNLFRVDPETGAIEESPCVVARVPGEPMCSVGLRGKAYVGIYVNSLISVYDPEKPFAFRTNPRELIELGAAYQQTRPRAAVTDGTFVYITSDSAYNHLGGALAVIDPETEHIDVYHHLVPDQNLPTLAYDPVTGLLWGGTDRWGQMHSHPPTQPSALIYAFDPQTRKVVTHLTPWPEADVVTVHGVSAQGAVLASHRDELAVIDSKTQEILYQGPRPGGITGHFRLGSDGAVYCLGDGVFYRWNMKENQLRPVVQAPECVFFTEPSPGTWLLASPKSVYRLRQSW